MYPPAPTGHTAVKTFFFNPAILAIVQSSHLFNPRILAITSLSLALSLFCVICSLFCFCFLCSALCVCSIEATKASGSPPKNTFPSITRCKSNKN